MESLDLKDIKITDIKGFDPNKVYLLNILVDKNKISSEQTYDFAIQLKKIFDSLNVKIIITELVDGITIEPIEPKEESKDE